MCFVLVLFSLCFPHLLIPLSVCLYVGFASSGIEESTRDDILRNYEASFPGPPPVTLFQRAAEEIKSAMAQEIYPSFLQSVEYQDMSAAGVL